MNISSELVMSRKCGHDDDLRDSKPSAKKSRHNRDEEEDLCDGSAGNETTLPVDALMVVMEFLNPKDLLHTAFSCKTLRDMVTTKMVVKSALIHGGHAKKTMEELYNLMSKYSIHVPSPLRLLKLSNGKFCEFCLQDKVNFVRPGIGVFACWECVTNQNRSHRYAAHWRAGADSERCSLTKAWKISWVRYSRNALDQAKYQVIFNHQRVAASEYGRNYYFWSHHRSDLAGERVGPIVDFDSVDEMCNHFSSLDEMNEGIDNYLTNNLNAPVIERYNAFNETYTDMQQRAQAAVRERDQKKRAKTAKTKENKVIKVKKMLDDLTALIDEPFRDFAMKRVENSHFNSASTKMSATPCICLQTSFINWLLRPYIITPSKMKQKIMKELAATINGKLHMITSKRILAMNFLSSGEDQAQKALKQYVAEKLQNLQAFFDVGPQHSTNRINDRFFALLEEDHVMGAIGHVMSDNFSPMLLTVEPTVALARPAMDRYDEATIKRLADSVWWQCWRRCSQGSTNGTGNRCYVEAVTASQDMFGDALAALDEYSTWLLDKRYPVDRRKFYQRNIAVSQQYLSLLLKKDFDDLEKASRWKWEHIWD